MTAPTGRYTREELRQALYNHVDDFLKFYVPDAEDGLTVDRSRFSIDIARGRQDNGERDGSCTLSFIAHPRFPREAHTKDAAADTLALLHKIMVVEGDPLGWVEDSSIARDRYLAALDVLGCGETVRVAAKESGYHLKTPEQVLWTRDSL